MSKYTIDWPLCRQCIPIIIIQHVYRSIFQIDHLASASQTYA